MNRLFLFLALISGTALGAQAETPNNWWDMDRQDDNFPGVSAKKAHDYLNGKVAKEVVVAVIDSGVDVEHEDLKAAMWTNADEIPGNGIDDDKNGYVDDVHGWNFIGGADGKNVNYENLEAVRLYNRYHKLYNNRNREGLKKSERAEYDLYKDLEKTINEKVEEVEPQFAQYDLMKSGFDTVIKSIGKPVEEITPQDVAAVTQKDMMTTQIKDIIANYTQDGTSFEDIYNEIEGAVDYYGQTVNYNYNVDYDARDIVGDNPGNLDDRNYGNNDVTGPDAGHGTHVAGIIAAVRDNEVGVNGVGGANVKIMSVRTVPNGDERDKDVANAIRYAVDNGASVINMSFGKGYSPYKKAVDAAMKYAEKNDVLIVHAAGNEGKMLTLTNNYPNDTYQGRKRTGKTWIEVGAASAFYNEELPANFSNYDKKYVDVFAPGRDIYSTIPGSKYASFNGTSMAAPMVAGIAALVRSYFPDLKAKQVREVILESALPVELSVKKPGEEEEMISFAELSETGALANAYAAVLLAERTKGKNRRAGKRDPALVKY